MLTSEELDVLLSTCPLCRARRHDGEDCRGRPIDWEGRRERTRAWTRAIQGLPRHRWPEYEYDD